MKGFEEIMPGVTGREGQPIEIMIKLLKKQVEKAGIVGEIKRRSHYEKPSIKRKRKRISAQKRIVKQARMSGM